MAPVRLISTYERFGFIFFKNLYSVLLSSVEEGPFSLNLITENTLWMKIQKLIRNTEFYIW